MVVCTECFYKIFADRYIPLKMGKIFTLKVVIGKGAEIFMLKHVPDSGLLIKKVNNSLFEAMTFLPVDIAGVFTIRAIINR